jgi:hypothetical protein
MARRARTRERRAGARIESPAQAGERSPDGTAATRPRPSISQQPDAERSLVATAERVLGVSEATSREPEQPAPQRRSRTDNPSREGAA